MLEDAPNASPEIGQGVVNMKVVMKPIEVVTTHSKEGVIRPEKYRIIDGEETIAAVVSSSLIARE
ncbi:hypothetical protein DP73_17770 [Desulfosporosinus sp. HMP52]|nr:hypothetical protein DP73_17770 [Desulfosporosinus sp. HMP52]